MTSRINQMHANGQRPVLSRKGTGLVYVTVCLPIMVLICSLAVDYGRAQTAKTQLQAVADAAARAAGQDLANYQTTNQATIDAMGVANSNKVDGQTFSLLAADVVYGTWNSGSNTFSAGASPYTAVQVTAYRYASRGTAIPTLWAAVMGNFTVNVHATAVAYVTRGLANFNAQSTVTFNDTGLSYGGTWDTDSYVANTQSYNSSVAGNYGDLCTNGNVNYVFTTPSNGGSGTNNMICNYITGQIYTANGADCTVQQIINNSAPGTYWAEYGATDDPGPSTTEMSTPATFPTPVMPAHNTNPSIPAVYLNGSYSNGLQDLNVSDGSYLSLPGGVYTLNSLSISNGSTVQFTGPVTLNIATNITINAAALEAVTDTPKDMKINVCNTASAGSNTVTITNPTHGVYADMNAPLANFTYTEPNQGNDYYGRIYSNTFTINCNGNGGFHADESLNTTFHIVQ